MSHCSAVDWNLNFIHRLVYIRPVMYSNRASVQPRARESLLVRFRLPDPDLFPSSAIIFSISIEKSSIGEEQKFRGFFLLPSVYPPLPIEKDVKDDIERETDNSVAREDETTLAIISFWSLI